MFFFVVNCMSLFSGVTFSYPFTVEILQVYVALEDTLMVRPPAGLLPFLSSLWDLRFPRTVEEAKEWMETNYTRFSGDYYRLFWFLTAGFVLSEARLVLLGAMVILIQYWNVEDIPLREEHRISVGLQKVVLFLLALYVSGVVPVILSSIPKVSFLIFLHMLCRSPKVRDHSYLSEQTRVQ